MISVEEALRHCLALATPLAAEPVPLAPVSYTHLRAHETVLDLVCRLLLEKKKKNKYANLIMTTNKA